MPTRAGTIIKNPSRIPNLDREKLTEQKIRTKTAIEDVDDMSDEYYVTLNRLLLEMAESELALAYPRYQWLSRAPLIEQSLIISNILRSHLRLANTMFKLTKSVGFEPSSFMGRYYFYTAPGFGGSNPVNSTESEMDDRIPLPYHPIATWLELIMSLFCVTRALSIKLENTKSSSFGPWKRSCRIFIDEKKMDLALAESWMKKFAFNKSMKKETEPLLSKWYAVAVEEFVVQDEVFLENQKRFDLVEKDISELNNDFKNEMRIKCSELGLRFPQ